MSTKDREAARPVQNRKHVQARGACRGRQRDREHEDVARLGAHDGAPAQRQPVRFGRAWGRGAPLAPADPPLAHLAVRPVEGLTVPGPEPRAAEVGEVPREPPRLIEEHTRVLRLRKSGFRHLQSRTAFSFVAHLRILLRIRALRTSTLRSSRKFARASQERMKQKKGRD